MSTNNDPEQKVTDSYWCPDCDCEVEFPEPAYECGNCGETFSRSNSIDGDSHRCPFCSKFSGKIGDECCPDCGAEVEACQIDENGERIEEE